MVTVACQFLGISTYKVVCAQTDHGLGEGNGTFKEAQEGFQTHRGPAGHSQSQPGINLMYFWGSSTLASSACRDAWNDVVQVRMKSTLIDVAVAQSISPSDLVRCTLPLAIILQKYEATYIT
ncbi:hypothetical protein DFH08DRAFT_804163 [Mycena albidolilacea]|uniref:Uncharacterized protein n=1 Tax=Mycena albidolilacea TaxID=1033008 RepID=A0AAD7ACP1_9AGAR|nr:hypothetical protein DFH08DRAFT_804163 [Mycena albidolilacea]